QKVDVIVVSAGDPDHRLPAAIDLLKRGLAKKIWAIPSGSRPVLRERQAIASFAKRNNVEKSVIVLPKRSKTLLRDARLISVRMRRSHVKRLPVAAPLVQSARVRLTFERIASADVLAWKDRTTYRAARWW